MYAQAAIKSNTLLRNGAYGIVMRGVQKCTRVCSSLRGRNRLPLCCIKLDTATGIAYEKGENLKNILKSLLLATLMIFALQALITTTFRWTLVDPRIWNFSLRALNWTRVVRVLTYMLPFALCYVITGANLHGMLRPKEGTLSTFKEILINILLLAPWYYIWIIWLGPYHYLKTHGAIPSFSGFLYTFIYGVPFTMGVVATISTKFFKKTGRVWLGAFINAYIVAWTLLGVISLYA